MAVNPSCSIWKRELGDILIRYTLYGPALLQIFLLNFIPGPPSKFLVFLAMRANCEPFRVNGTNLFSCHIWLVLRQVPTDINTEHTIDLIINLTSVIDFIQRINSSKLSNRSPIRPEISAIFSQISSLSRVFKLSIQRDTLLQNVSRTSVK